MVLYIFILYFNYDSSYYQLWKPILSSPISYISTTFKQIINFNCDFDHYLYKCNISPCDAIVMPYSIVSLQLHIVQLTRPQSGYFFNYSPVVKLSLLIGNPWLKYAFTYQCIFKP